MRNLVVLILAAAIGGCGAQPAPVEIGRLVSRDSTLVIHSTERGVVYTVHGPQGGVRRGLTLSELKVRNPRLGRIVENGVAWAGQ